MAKDRTNIRFNALRNALYHTARRRSLERMNRLFNFLVVILGTAAVADALQVTGIPPYLIGMAVAVIGALQLVFDFGRQARDHQQLQRDYYALLAEIEAKPDATAEECAAWQGKLIRITADEPPVLRAVDAKAYNDAIDASGDFTKDQRLHVPLIQRMLSGLLAFDGYSYETPAEIKQAKLTKRV